MPPFYRAPAAQLVNARGAGLGLAIVRDIAALHGASISLADGAAAVGLKVVLQFPKEGVMPPADVPTASA